MLTTLTTNHVPRTKANIPTIPLMQMNRVHGAMMNSREEVQEGKCKRSNDDEDEFNVGG
jgi:hypothetical protein